MMRHALSVELPKRRVRLEIQDEENTVGFEA